MTIFDQVLEALLLPATAALVVAVLLWFVSPHQLRQLNPRHKGPRP